MKLFTKDIERRLQAQYPKGAELKSQKAIAKIFNPYGKGTWYIINQDPNDPDYLWAIVDLDYVEIGSVSKSELESLRIPPFRLPLERDLYWTPVNAELLFKRLQRKEVMRAGGKALADKRKKLHQKRAARMEQGGEVREWEEVRKIKEEKAALVEEMTPQQMADAWNAGHTLGEKNPNKWTAEQVSENPEYYKMYLIGSMWENELNEEEHTLYVAQGGTAKRRKYAVSKKDDKDRKAKPIGYRFKDTIRGGKRIKNYKRPTLKQIIADRQKPLSKRRIYFESRINRADKNLRQRLEEGGVINPICDCVNDAEWVAIKEIHEKAPLPQLILESNILQAKIAKEVDDIAVYQQELDNLEHLLPYTHSQEDVTEYEQRTGRTIV